MEPHQTILLYDGVCGLCNRFNRFVLRRDTEGALHFAAQQSEFARELLAREGRDPDALDTLFLWKDGRLLSGARAVLAVLRQLGSPWSWTAPLGLLPTWLLDFGYRLIARHRYRFFGRSERCELPEPGWVERFIASE